MKQDLAHIKTKILTCSVVIVNRQGVHVRGIVLQFLTEVKIDPSRSFQIGPEFQQASYSMGRLRLKCDGTRSETRFCLSAKRTSPFKSAGASVPSTTGGRGVRISGSNAGYTKFRGCERYWLPTPFASSPSLPLPCVTVWHRVSTGLYR